MRGIELPVDLNDPYHPNVRIVPMARDLYGLVRDYIDELEAIRPDCPGCEHSPHPTEERIGQLRAMPYRDYLWSPEWRRTRRVVLHAADYFCRVCRQRNALHVHHLNYHRLGHEALTDLAALCEPCHNQVHGMETPKRRRAR